MRETLAYILFGSGGLGLAGWGAVRLWKFASTWTGPRHPPVSVSEPLKFHSDQPPPAGTIAYNKAIVEACGDRTSDSFKLGLLIGDGNLSRAVALYRARVAVEAGIAPGAVLQAPHCPLPTPPSSGSAP